ncbi:MAG TPA: DNA repair protein RecO [Gammaproteobacteria bacterium]
MIHASCGNSALTSNNQRQRVELEPAYVLHQFDYRDSSRIVEFLVRDHGRVAAVSRGVRRSSNRQRGLLRPFQPLLLSWTGRELGTMTGLESAGPPQALEGEAVLAGFYLNELCLRLIAAHDPHPEIFVLYANTLNALNTGPVAPALRRFEAGLLDALGYGLNLAVEQRSGKAVESGAQYLFHVDSGPERATPQSDHAILVRGEHLLAMSEGRFDDPQVARDAQRIFRQAIDRHLGGRPLKSRDVMREMVARKRGAPESR